MQTSSKIIDFKDLKNFISPLDRVVHCHGVFDVLHAGHLKYFSEAKRHGDTLVVTLTSDRYVNKGPGRPYFPAGIRAEMLAALSVVDFVAISDYPTAVPAIEALKPDYYVKGPDYKDRSKDLTGEIYNEEEAVKKHGGSVVFTDDETYSSSSIINQFFNQFSDKQQEIIEHVKSLGGESYVLSELDKLSKERVVVVGEPIYDIYRFCIPENISSKSPSISARFQREETYEGGSWAIVNHLRSFVKDVQLYYPGGMKIPSKTRYISVDKSQRIFEITDMEPDNFRLENPSKFTKLMLKEANSADICLLADFGHRLFEGEVLEACRGIQSFTGLNVQTNSSNFGFNLCGKHHRFDLLSLDTREARLYLKDRSSDPMTLARMLKDEFTGRHVALTLGPNGAWSFSRGNESYSPAFSEGVIDATGAGDAFFSLITCLSKIGTDERAALFISNVFAGLKTRIIGNSQAVSKAALGKALVSILK